MGWDNKEIAEALDVTPQMVCYTKNSQLGQEKLGLMRASADANAQAAMAEVQALLPKALQTMREILEKDEVDYSQKRLAAQDLMDRGGLKPVEKSVNVNRNVSKEELDEIEEEQMNAARETGNLVETEDTEYEDVTDSEDDG